MNRYLLLTTEECSNIAIIGCDENGEFLSDQVESALSEHLDMDVQVNSIEQRTDQPLQLSIKFSYDDDDELILDNAYLKETWLY